MVLTMFFLIPTQLFERKGISVTEQMLRSKEAKKITLVGSMVNILLTILKLIAGFIGKSGAMIADGVHSLSDLLTDVVVLIGFKFTEKPEDDDHNYGHGKFETLATAIISIFLFVVGFEIFKNGAVNIWKVFRGGTLPKPGMIALAAATVSIVAKEVLYHYTLAVGRKISSSSVIANAWHHRSDVLSSLGTFVGIGGAIALGNRWTVLDPVASVVVSIMIFKVAFAILMPSLNELMETSLTEEEKTDIATIIESCPGILYHHELRTRRLGNRAVIEFYIHVDSKLNIRQAHDISTEAEEKLRGRFGEDAIITVHIEPHGEE